MSYIIKVKNLSKKFDKLTALNNINLEIKEGEIFSLLGPNGAGKTTLISILTTILKPTSGTATVNGYDIIKNPLDVRKSIGIVFQEPSLDDLLTAYENLYVHSVLYNIPRHEIKDRIENMLKTVKLYDRKNDIIKKYSGGMKRKLEIARGLIHTPKVLFLDEPTLGLDPHSRKDIWNYIKRIKKEHNITIILTTHYMEEADSLSDRVAIINKGNILTINTSNELKKEIGNEILILKADVNENEIKKLNFIKSLEKQNEYYIITSKEIARNINLILKYVKNIKEMEIRKTSLEDVFIKLTGEKLDEKDT